MGHKAGMSEDPSAEPAPATFGDRIRARVDRVQGWAEGIYEKVPPRTRRGLQRAFSVAILAVGPDFLARHAVGLSLFARRTARIKHLSRLGLCFALGSFHAPSQKGVVSSAAVCISPAMRI